MTYLFLRVSGKIEIPLGDVAGAADVSALLRHVADYFDDNPAASEALFCGSTAGLLPGFVAAGYLAAPFGGNVGDVYTSS